MKSGLPIFEIIKGQIEQEAQSELDGGVNVDNRMLVFACLEIIGDF